MATGHPSSGQYRFKIDAYTPETIPLSRLSEYLHDFSVLLGEMEHVHFMRLERGSVVALVRVQREAEPKVRERLHSIRLEDAPQDAMRAAKAIDERLRRDNAKGAVLDAGGSNVLIFPGRDLNKLSAYGPFNQPGTLDGIPILIGGGREDVSIHLESRDKGQLHICTAKRNIAKAIAPYLFTSVIRAEGIGRWLRLRQGDWEMRKFTINAFQPLKETTLRQTIKELREIPAEWKNLEDPYAELARIRLAR